MVSVEKILVSFGGFTLLNGISFVINKRDRIALTGKNGAGKSTLLKIIAGLQKPTDGRVTMPHEFTVGYLPQVMNLSDTTSVFAETEKAFGPLFELRKQTEALQEELSQRTDYDTDGYQTLLDRINRQTDQLQMSGIYNYKAEVEKTLLGLGFLRTDFDRPSSEFSGGWRMRIELAKVLLSRPDLLLLDEPTNHLDIESIQWLENFLVQSSRAVLLVSHDRAFLDNVCSRTLEISLGRLYDYKVPYSQFVELRKERHEQQVRAYENQQKMIQDTEAFIERFRYKATKAVQVQSRIKQLEKLERLEVDQEDNAVMNLHFPPAPHSGSFPVIAEEVSKSFGDHLVFKEVSFRLRRGEKVAFVGRNGEGKSTLVKCIMGQLPYEGKLELGHLVKIAYFAQNQPQLLDESLTVFETVDRVAVGDIRMKIKDILGAFMFGGEASEKKVGVLSGGERSRLAMILLLLSPANLLILDEPTNHLDMRSKDVLKQAIKEFAGTVIVVSHDRDFLNGLVEKVYEFGGGAVREHLGGIAEFLERKKLENLQQLEYRKQEQPDKRTPASQSDGRNAKERPSEMTKSSEESLPKPSLSYEERKEYNRQVKKLQQVLDKCEADVTAAEQSLAEVEVLLSTPEGAADTANHTRYGECSRALDNAMSYWEQAANELESYKNKYND